MPKPNQTPKTTQTFRQIVFEDFLQEWFDELYPTNAGGPSPSGSWQPREAPSAPPTEEIADFLYEGRPRLTASDVAEILRSAGAPEPWSNPEACIGVGTLIIHPSKYIEPVREAFSQLRLALARMVSEAEAERSKADRQTFLSTNFRCSNRRLSSEIAGILNDFENNPRFRHLRARSSPPWQVQAVLLYDKYLEIVHDRPTANMKRATALKFVQEMLKQLGVAAKIEAGTIDKALKRGVQALRDLGVESKLTKEGGIKSQPIRHPTE